VSRAIAVPGPSRRCAGSTSTIVGVYVIHVRSTVDHKTTRTSPKIRTSCASRGVSNHSHPSFARGFVFAYVSVFVPVERNVACGDVAVAFGLLVSKRQGYSAAPAFCVEEVADAARVGVVVPA